MQCTVTKNAFITKASMHQTRDTLPIHRIRLSCTQRKGHASTFFVFTQHPAQSRILIALYWVVLGCDIRSIELHDSRIYVFIVLCCIAVLFYVAPGVFPKVEACSRICWYRRVQQWSKQSKTHPGLKKKKKCKRQIRVYPHNCAPYEGTPLERL